MGKRIMSELFLRKIFVDVYSGSSQFVERFEGRVKNIPGYDIDFSVSKTHEKEPGESTVTIYGLNEETRRKFDDEYTRIILHAGYEDNVKSIGVGDILEIKHIFEEHTCNTIITFCDGVNSYVDSFISKTYPAGTKYSSLITDLANNMGLPISLKEIENDITFQNSITLHGTTNQYLDKVCKSLGVKYYIQNEKIIIKSENTTINDNEAILIDHGLIGSIEKKIRKKLKPFMRKLKPLKTVTEKSLANRAKTIAKYYQKQEDKDKEIECSILLNPNINIGTKVQCVSKFVNNFAVVKELNHSGGTRSDFVTKITATIM
jgi:hypothetical protein